MDSPAASPASPQQAGLPPRTPPLTQALPSLAAWARHFRDADVPVLTSTAEALEALRANEDDVDANGIGEMVSADPLMTLKVLAYAATHRPPGVLTDTETVTTTLVLMGISPFFRAFGPQATLAQWFADEPLALEGLQEVLRRAHRSATFALAFAVHRMDRDAAVIHEAALLHDFAEMLLWCHAPALALRIRDRQRADPALRSATVQRELLHIELRDLQQALMKTWHLPDLLIRISDERHARQASVRNVLLAVRLARHSAEGWDNPAIPDDITDIAELLNLSPAAATNLVRSIED